MKHAAPVINDVTGLNPVVVHGVVRPTSIAEVQAAVRGSTLPISIGGGRFSMGGQTASPESLHMDMRKLNRVVSFSPEARRIRVQAGIRWCDIQRIIDPHNLSIMIMQTYANFTVGGSLSVNVHGRYVGLGPLILSVRSLAVVLADGQLREASPGVDPDLFYGVVGGYGGLGIIVEAELDLAANTRVRQVSAKLATRDYLPYFRKLQKGPGRPVFHNADLYPPGFQRMRAVTWVETDKRPTVPHRLMRLRRSYPVTKYFVWAVSESPLGKIRREFVFDPVVYLRPRVHWRNYEAGYDVAQLEPASRARNTYVLQEYFVPVERFPAFAEAMAGILNRHRVNVLNVSVRHALADPGSLLAWAREEVFAFVLYYKQGVTAADRNQVAVWTRELIEAAIDLRGTFYLPYQAWATSEQFHRAYPRAQEMFALKRKLDPAFRFRNVLWDTYYAPTQEPGGPEMTQGSNFHAVYSSTRSRDAFYLFLQNIFHLYPEARFHTLIQEACTAHQSDEAIYGRIQAGLPGIKPFLADLFYALPALRKQKREMTRQALALLDSRKRVDGCLEIGTTGRYASELRRHIQIGEPLILLNDVAPTNSVVDILERGRLRRLGRFVPLNGYAPISPAEVPDASVDLVSCFIGLHHAPPAALAPFIDSLVRVLRPGGIFILRDHDVDTPQMNAFASLAHDVFNAGVGLAWADNAGELRHFASVEEWVRRLGGHGLRQAGPRMLQANDPTRNTLMAFTRAVA